MKFDLHVHTNLSSDTKTTIEEAVSAARRQGLSGMAVANHNAFYKPQRYDDFYIIPSCEFTTDAGHILAFFLKEDITCKMKKDDKGRFPWQEVIQLSREQGALTFLAHPFSPKTDRPIEVYTSVDGIEVYNGRVAYSHIRDANARALTLCRELKCPMSIGSDAHRASEIGTSYFECSLDEKSISEPDFDEKLKAELLSKNGKFFAGKASFFTVYLHRICLFFSEGRFKKVLKNSVALLIAILSAPFKKDNSGYLKTFEEEEK